MANHRADGPDLPSGADGKKAADAIWAFGPFEVDEGRYELRRGDEKIELAPKVFDFLVYLVRHRDRVVSKQELLRELWPEESISESVLPTNVAKLRRALGDNRSDPQMIATAHGRGYRFVAKVRTRRRDAIHLPSSGYPALGSEGAEDDGRRELFIGRKAEFAALRAGLEEAFGGRGRMIFLVGEPGIGKTRTAEEFAAAARRKGARVLAGRCPETEGAPAFWPWIQILRGYIAGCDDERLRTEVPRGAVDLAQLVPDLAERLPELRSASPLDPAEARFRLFDSVSRFLRNASRRQPLVLILEDLHSADDASLLLLQFLACDMGNTAMLAVGTFRDVELRHFHARAHVLSELVCEPHCERILLRGLARDEAGHFIQRLVRESEGRSLSEPSEGLLDSVYAMTEGNPFFIGEIVRLMRDETASGHGPLQAQRPEIALPHSVREAIGRRLSVLSEECNQVLRIAALVGRDFSLPTLERVAGASTDHLLEVLEEAVAASVVRSPSGTVGRYSFSHALVQQTLYEELSTPVRVRLHRQVGAVLEEMYANNPEPHLAELAHHFFQASPGGKPGKAISYLVRAGDAARRLLAHEEAAAHYYGALQALALEVPLDESKRGELLVSLAECQDLSGDRNRARESFRQATSIARTLGAGELLARAALGFTNCQVFDPPSVEEARNLLEEALDALGEGHDALRSRLLGCIASEALMPHTPATRVTLSEQAVALARRCRDRATLYDALRARAAALIAPEQLAEQLEAQTEMLRIAEETGDKHRILRAHDHRIRSLLAAGDVAAADRGLDACHRIAQELRRPKYAYAVALFRVSRATSDGRFAEAAHWLDTSRALGVRAQDPAREAVHAWLEAWLLRERGGLFRLEPRVEDLLARYSWVGPFVRGFAATVYAAVGRESEARVEFQRCVADGLAAATRDQHWTTYMAVVAELSSLLGDRHCAAEVHDLLLPFADRNVVHALLRTSSGPVAHFLGITATVLERWDEAETHFEAALAMGHRMGSRPHVVRTQMHYARMLRTRADRGDAERARRLASDAQAGAQALGIEGPSQRKPASG